VPTEELRAVVARRISPERIHLVPNGVDTEQFRPAPIRTIGRVRTVLYVGRLSAEKNLEILVDAAAKLQGRFDLRLVMIGQGPLREALEQRARRRGVAAELVPVVDHQALPARFAAASVFVLPSHTEGHPKVLLEAMACGLPCVASNVGGSRSIVTDGESGLLFEPDDPDALAERLERVLGQDLGERARAVVTERYALGALVAREIELLRRIGR
jgi:glycosyltransferase involved in cell wall biosynthesis